jgi:flagellar motor switch protein FliM
MPDEHVQFLQQSDVDVLLATLLASQESGAVQGGRAFSEVKIYDFARPENMPSEIVRALESVNTLYARSLSGLLTAMLGEPVKIEPLSADQMTFRQFCNAIPEITTASTFTIGGSELPCLLELNPHLSWYFIDRGLGGHGEILESLREFTTLERGLVEDLFRRMLREMTRAWESLLPLAFHAREVIQSPVTAHVAQPDDRMVVCSFGITLNNLSGMSYYAMPVSTLDFDRMLSGARNRDAGEDDLSPAQEHHQLVSQLGHAGLPVRVCFPDIILDVGVLAHLKVGDVVQLDCTPKDGLEVRIGDVRCFSAMPVTRDSKLAAEISDLYVEATP